MSLTARSTIEDAIAAVAGALDKAGIKAVLVGGACATVYSGGTYESEDLDLILRSAPSQRELDDAMASVGFTRKDAQYVHSKTDFFVEFPRPPLAIGRDLRIVPTQLRLGRSRITALSPTDSCRDRLSAYYFWQDRQSLDVAVSIALRNRVDMKVVRSWSESEGASEQFRVFQQELVRARRARRRTRRMRDHRAVRRAKPKV